MDTTSPEHPNPVEKSESEQDSNQLQQPEQNPEQSQQTQQTQQTSHSESPPQKPPVEGNTGKIVEDPKHKPLYELKNPFSVAHSPEYSFYGTVHFIEKHFDVACLDE